MSRKKTPESIPQKEVESPQNESKPSPFESLRDMIGLVSAGAGIFAALLYLAGRSYASGYFEAMNIAEYQLTFSLSEYGAAAWIPLFLYPIGMIVVSSFLGGILSAIGDWSAPWCTRIKNWLKRLLSSKLPAIHLPEASRKTKLWFAIADRAFTVSIFIMLVLITLQVLAQYGNWVGRINVQQNALQVEINSSLPLALDDNGLTPVSASGQDYYAYKGLHLLTVNNGKYYLFKDIDPVTCKPSKVYIINAEQNLQVNLLPAESLAGQCQLGASPQVIATPTSTLATP